MNKEDTKNDVLKKISETRVGTKSTKMVSISISSNTHQKISNLCWILHTNERPKISVVTTNIIEQFIDEYREEIIKLQSKKKELF